MQKDLLWYGQQEGHEWQIYVVNDVPLSAQSSWQPTSVVRYSIIYNLLLYFKVERDGTKEVLLWVIKVLFTRNIFQKSMNDVIVWHWCNKMAPDCFLKPLNKLISHIDWWKRCNWLPRLLGLKRHTILDHISKKY